MDAKSHWEMIYQTKAPDAVSWYKPHLDKSLELIHKACPDRSASIIDVGGGESTLVDDLLAEDFQNITVLDISETAIAVSKQRLGDKTTSVTWIAANIEEASLPQHHYDVWHDRAVFHFLTTPEERTTYMKKVTKSLKPGGHVIMATFGPDGPLKCSNLNVVRYDLEALAREFGPGFNHLESTIEVHETPFGTTQQFLYYHCRLDKKAAIN